MLFSIQPETIYIEGCEDFEGNEKVKTKFCSKNLTGFYTDTLLITVLDMYYTVINKKCSIFLGCV